MITGALSRVMNRCNEALMRFCDYLSIGGPARCLYMGEVSFNGNFCNVFSRFSMFYAPVNPVVLCYSGFIRYGKIMRLCFGFCFPVDGWKCLWHLVVILHQK